MTRTAAAVCMGLAMLLVPSALAQSCAPPSSAFEEHFDGGFEHAWDTFTFASGSGFQGFPPKAIYPIGSIIPR